MISHVSYQVMTSHSCPATRALASSNDQIPAREYQNKKRTSVHDDASRPTCSKRHCTHFDMADMISVVKPLEDTYGFPAIEWSYDDECISSNNDFGKRKLHSSWEGALDTVTKDDNAIFIGLHRRASSEFLFGKEARGNSLVRAKFNTSCLVTLAACSNNSLPPRTEDPNCHSKWEAACVSGLSSTRKQELS